VGNLSRLLNLDLALAGAVMLPAGIVQRYSGFGAALLIMPLLSLLYSPVEAITRTLALLPKGASIINIGRGEHVDDEALIAALDSGYIAHATLDVFRTEPLPADHPFWRHPKITVMPHTARRQHAARIIPHVVENIRRFRAGRPLLQVVDRARY
jgi:glyoxylate/hydroxypyruvate reductase A